MSATGGELVTRSLRRLGVISVVQEPSDEEMQTGLTALNAFIDSLGVLRLAMFKLLRTPKTLASGTASYTIGSGGSIDIVRPLFIQKAGLILDTGAPTPTEAPLKVYDDDEWASIAQKTLQSGIVAGVYYDRGNVAGLGLVYPFPIPNVGTLQLMIYTPEALTVVAKDTIVIYPAGYERMLEYNGAVEMADHFEKPLNPRTERIAIDSLTAIKHANARVPFLSFPANLPGVAGRRGDIRTGG